MTDSDRQLITHVLEGQKALQQSVSDLHGIVARMDERVGLTFSAIQERQRRSSERVNAIESEAIARERSILDAVQAVREDVERHREDVAGDLKPLISARSEDLGARKVLLWAVGGVAALLGTVVGGVLVALLSKKIGG